MWWETGPEFDNCDVFRLNLLCPKDLDFAIPPSTEVFKELSSHLPESKLSEEKCSIKTDNDLPSKATTENEKCTNVYLEILEETELPQKSKGIFLLQNSYGGLYTQGKRAPLIIKIW